MILLKKIYIDIKEKLSYLSIQMKKTVNTLIGKTYVEGLYKY